MIIKIFKLKIKIKTVIIFVTLILSIVFLFTHSRVAYAISQKLQLELFLFNGNVEPLTHIDENKLRQIKYKFEGIEIDVTNNNYPNADPYTDAEKIVWMSQIGSYWHVFLKDIITEETLQLTKSGNNVAPKISGDYVVWEGQVDGVWQIFFV